jgi:hypothetical protein
MTPSTRRRGGKSEDICKVGALSGYQTVSLSASAAIIPTVGRRTMNRKSYQSMSKPSGFTMPTPCWLDRLADAELQQGHIARAEQLANRAAELREASR